MLADVLVVGVVASMVSCHCDLPAEVHANTGHLNLNRILACRHGWCTQGASEESSLLQYAMYMLRKHDWPILSASCFRSMQNFVQGHNTNQ